VLILSTDFITGNYSSKGYRQSVIDLGNKSQNRLKPNHNLLPYARITRFIHELMEEIEEIESNDIYRFLAENKSIITQQLDVIYKINADVRLLSGKFTETYKIQLHGNSMGNVEYDRYDKLTKLRESYKLLNTHLNFKQGFFTCCSNYLNNPSLDLKRNALSLISKDKFNLQIQSHQMQSLILSIPVI
jgi:hypothetical protein